MQHGYANIAAQTDIPRVGAARRYGTKNSNESNTKERPRRKSHLPKITTKNEDQTMDQINGLEAKISKEETRTLPTIDLGEVHLMPTRLSLPGPTLHIGTTIRIMEDHKTNAQISHSKDVMDTDLEMDLSAIRMETG